jgi:hypothetical protein
MCGRAAGALLVAYRRRVLIAYLDSIMRSEAMRRMIVKGHRASAALISSSIACVKLEPVPCGTQGAMLALIQLGLRRIWGRWRRRSI